METLSASDAKREFGEVILKAQKGPIGINKNGKPVAVMMSATAFAELERLRETFLHMAIDQGIDDVKVGRVTDGPEVMARLRKLVADAGL